MLGTVVTNIDGVVTTVTTYKDYGIAIGAGIFIWVIFQEIMHRATRVSSR